MMAANQEQPRAAPANAPSSDSVKNKALAECFRIFDLKREEGQHACRYSECVKKGTAVKQKLVNGYKNLVSHLDNNHPTYEQDYQNRDKPGTKDEHGHFVTVDNSEAKNMFMWMEFVLDNDMPINSVNKQTVRDKVIMKPISGKNFVATAHKLVRVVEGRIKNEAKKFPGKCIVIDTWGKKHASSSYTAVELVYDCRDDKGNRLSPPLLAFAPLLNEESSNADSYVEFMEWLLNVYEMRLQDVVVMIADNCSTNKSAANKAGFKFIGCASHRLNLAAKKLVTDDQELKRLVDKVFALFQKLKTQKWSARLKQETALAPIDRNETRFKGTADGIERFFQLKPHLDKIADDDLAPFMLTAAEAVTLSKTWEGVMEDIKSATCRLQARNLPMNLAEVRTICVELIGVHKGLKGSHIDPNHEIVANKHLENGIVKIINGVESTLTEDEQWECRIFLRDQDADQQGNRIKAHEHVRKQVFHSDLSDLAEGAPAGEGNKQRVDFDAALGKRKFEADQARLRSKYIDLTFILAGSIDIESLFSTTKRIATWDRGKLLPRTLEMLVFLKQNRRFWDIEAVREAMDLPELPADDLEADEQNDVEEAYNN
jgi:hypothetical protein